MEKLAEENCFVDEENCFVDEDTKLTLDDDVLSYVEFGIDERLKYTEEFSKPKNLPKSKKLAVKKLFRRRKHEVNVG